MPTEINDKRTPDQQKTHKLAVVGRDSFLSGWGRAADGYSRAVWACSPDVNPDRVYNWVKSRGDMQYVSVINLDTYRPPRDTVHMTIYPVDPGHVAAKY